MRLKNQQGLASIVVVSILVVLLTLITIGFARIMGRALSNSLNNQQSVGATYAAESGLNDAVAYLRTHTSATATKCNDLIGTSATPGPFYSVSNLSGDNNTKYTCLLINRTPSDLAFQNILPLKSQVVRATTNDIPSSYMISWQNSDIGKTAIPTIANPIPANSLASETSWNSNGYQSVLRVTIYPIPDSGNIANVQDDSKTFFFYPNTNGGSTVDSVSYGSTDSGSLLSAHCGINDPGTFKGTADYRCNVIITGLDTAVTSAGETTSKTFYLRISPVYSKTDVKIKANYKVGPAINSTKFISTQGVIDVTAKSAGDTKRLQARIDISNTGGGVDPNISSQDDFLPEQAIRSANAICKRLNVDTGTNTTSIDSAYCNLALQPPAAPTVTISASPNPVDSGTTTNLTWTVANATSCTASSNPSGVWSGNPSAVTGTHSGPSLAINSATTFTIKCDGSGSASDSVLVNVNGATPPSPPGGGPPPPPSSSPACSDGIDNDGDSKVDAADPGCHSDGNAANAGSYVPSDTDETDFSDGVIIKPPLVSVSTSPQRDGNPNNGDTWVSWHPASGSGPINYCDGYINGTLVAGGTGSSGGPQLWTVGSANYVKFNCYGPGGSGSNSAPGYDDPAPAPPPQLLINSLNVNGVWRQGPQCWSPGNPWHLQWRCTNSVRTVIVNGILYGRDVAPGTCNDAVHSLTICSANWTVSGGTPPIICNLRSNGVLLVTSFGSGSVGQLGWGGSGPGGQPNPDLSLTCWDSAGQVASRNWN